MQSMRNSIKSHLQELYYGQVLNPDDIENESYSEVSETDRAYIAGFFDGEGCVNFGEGLSGWYIRIFVVNTNREILEFIKSKYGGSINSMSRKEGWKQSFQLRICWISAVIFLEDIEPYLRLKAPQAHIAFAWDVLRPKNRFFESSEESKSAIDFLREELSYLNTRGNKNVGVESPIDRILRETEYAVEEIQ